MTCLSGQKIHRNRVEDYCTDGGCESGDIVGVYLDLNSGKMEFSKNQKKLGVAFLDVKGPVSPCVSLLKGQKVTLMQGNRQAATNPNSMAMVSTVVLNSSNI